MQVNRLLNAAVVAALFAQTGLCAAETATPAPAAPAPAAGKTWRRLADLRSFTPSGAVVRTELNLSRWDIKNIAPLKLEWAANGAAAPKVRVNGVERPVETQDGVCRVLVPLDGFDWCHNEIVVRDSCFVTPETAASKSPTTNHQPPTTNHEPPTTSHQPPTTNLAMAVFGSVDAQPGPRTSAAEFYLEHLDRAIPAFAEAARLFAAGDEAAANRVFAAYVRERLDVPAETKARYLQPSAAKRVQIKRDAERVLGGTMYEVGMSYTFPDAQIVWQYNPTWNGYIEWCWHLSTLRFLDELMRQYALDGDEKWADAWARHFRAFVRDEVCPRDPGPCDTTSWRSIETADRLHDYLPNDVWLLRKSPALTDDLVALVFRSLWEHGDRLRRHHAARGNWFANEMTALHGFAVKTPYFKESAEWRDYAAKMIEREVDEQMYPDGQQVELSTGYHPGVLRIFARVLETCSFAHVPPPARLRATLERMYEPYMAIMRPDRRIPALNDATIWPCASFFREGLARFPERADFRWFAGEQNAAPPAWRSAALPYSGWVALRDGWDAAATWAFMDCGPYGAGHQHEDKLNVLVVACGRELVNEGGWYDYDTSENRRYVLSTRSHNTVRFDGRDQNRARGYRWNGAVDAYKKADFLFATNAAVDWAEAAFDERYAGDPGEGLVHRRRLELRKDAPGGKPLVVVIDRFTCKDAKEHAYEQLWHLRGSAFTAFGPRRFVADYGGGVSLVGVHSDAAAAFVDKRGQTKPELQGWDPGRWDKHDAKPISTPVVCGAFTRAKRLVTVLQPRDASNAAAPCVEAVEADAAPAAKTYVVRFTDGSAATFREEPPNL